MELINKKDDQSIFDVLLENGGALSGLFDFLHANNLTSIDIPSGTYIAPEVMKQEVVDFYSKLNSDTNFSLASSDVSLPAYTILIQAINTLNEVIASGNYAPGTGVQQLEIPDTSVSVINSLNEVIATESMISGANDQQIAIPNVIHTDSDGELVELPANNSMVCSPAPDPNIWVRPAEWLAMEELDGSNQKFIGLVAVKPGSKSRIDMIAAVVGGYTIDWGDGSVINYASGVTATHVFDFDSISSPLTSEGWKQVMVTLTRQSTANNIVTFSFMSNSANCSNWLDVQFCLPYIINWGAYTSFWGGLQRVRVKGVTPTISFASLFNYANELRVIELDWSKPTTFLSMLTYGGMKKLPDLNLAGCTGAGQKFTMTRNMILDEIGNITCPGTTAPLSMSLGALKRVGNITLPNATSIAAIFIENTSFEGCGLITAPNCTNASQAFRTCMALKKINIDAPLLQDISQLAFNCYSCEEIYFTSCAGVTNTSLAFDSCRGLRKLRVPGLRYGFNITNGSMGRSDLVTLFNDLGTSVGAQTINITYNPGASELSAGERAIATGKGFTLIG